MVKAARMFKNAQSAKAAVWYKNQSNWVRECIRNQAPNVQTVRDRAKYANKRTNVRPVMGIRSRKSKKFWKSVSSKVFPTIMTTFLLERAMKEYFFILFVQPGIIAGDIYARVRISEHKTFQRRGADLVIIKKISLLEALTGVTMEIEHLDGKKYTIATAPGEVLINGELKTIKNLGMPFYKNSMSHGNLYI